MNPVSFPFCINVHTRALFKPRLESTATQGQQIEVAVFSPTFEPGAEVTAESSSGGTCVVVPSGPRPPLQPRAGRGPRRSILLAARQKKKRTRPGERRSRQRERGGGRRRGGFTTRAAAPASNFDLVWRARLAGYGPASIAAAAQNGPWEHMLLLLLYCSTPVFGGEDARGHSSYTRGGKVRRISTTAVLIRASDARSHLREHSARVDSFERHAAAPGHRAFFS